VHLIIPLSTRYRVDPDKKAGPQAGWAMGFARSLVL
jgi:hypothetical protein